MAFTRSAAKTGVSSTRSGQSKTSSATVKKEEQQTTPVLAKRTKADKGKQKASVKIEIPTNTVENSTRKAIKRKVKEETSSLQDKKIKTEEVTPVIETINVEPSTDDMTTHSTDQTVKLEKSTTKLKKERKPATPKVKKEPIVKVPKVKNEPKPKSVKTKKVFKLPPEASIYLNDAMRARVTRAMKQRMFVMSRELDPENENNEKFEVLGSVGNNYTVSIASTMKCTCMDYAIRRTHCKHILMVLLKVYRLPCDSQMFRSLHTTPILRLHARSNARLVDPSILVPKEIRQKILSISHHGHPELEPSDENTTKRRSLDTSDCPICFEEFEESNIEQIDFCKTCGNNVHQECFQLWARSKGSNASCVYCRSKWITNRPDSVAGSSKRSVRQLDPSHINEGYYANFAAELGIERKRDTSTYKINGKYPLRDAQFEE